MSFRFMDNLKGRKAFKGRACKALEKSLFSMLPLLISLLFFTVCARKYRDLKVEAGRKRALYERYKSMDLKGGLKSQTWAYSRLHPDEEQDLSSYIGKTGENIQISFFFAGLWRKTG